MAKSSDTLFRADEPASAGVRRIADALLRNGIVRIRHPSDDRDEDIHAVRTTIKHLRAILRMVRPVIGETVFQRQDAQWKKAAQRLGTARDLTVGRRSLEQLSQAASGRRSLRAFSMVQDAYARSFAPPSPAQREKAMAAVATILQRSRTHVQRWRIAADDWAAIGPGLEKVYRQCRRRRDEAFGKGSDEAFHRWRMRVKNLFYELQSLSPVWPGRLGRKLKQLKILQEKIGSDHDLTVLRSILRSTPDELGAEAVVKIVLRHLQRRSRKLRRASQLLGIKFFGEKPTIFIRQLEQHWIKWRRPAASSRPRMAV